MNIVRLLLPFHSDIKESGLFYCHPSLMCSSGVHTAVIDILRHYVKMVWHHSDACSLLHTHTHTHSREPSPMVPVNRWRCVASSFALLHVLVRIPSKLYLDIWGNCLSS